MMLRKPILATATETPAAVVWFYSEDDGGRNLEYLKLCRHFSRLLSSSLHANTKRHFALLRVGLNSSQTIILVAGFKG